MEYSEFERGSEWRKWDLHVHTPFSYHNSFPNWDDYVKNLKEKAVEHDVEVIGVTDYFCTDGYEKLLEECEPDTKSTSPRIKLANGKNLFLIPIIELRLDNFTDDNISVNIHIAFSPHILPSTIKSSFLETLEIRYQGKTLSCKESDLIKIGYAEVNHGSYNVNLDISSLNIIEKEKMLKKALSAISFSCSNFEDQLNDFKHLLKDAGITKESYLIIIANKGHGGLSDFKWVDANRNLSRAGNIRQNLLHLTDICFSNNTEDKEFLLGEKPGTSRKEIIERFRTFKPCIWGSDAHEIQTLFHPSNGATNDYTWIKADPTFEGLRQTLYEPSDRVKISEIRPDLKNDRNIITELKFLNAGELFGAKPLFLNDNLNAIIGGKSSGKSLLLYTIAKSIDPDQVENASTRLKFDGYTFEKALDFEVTWKNGEKNYFNKTNTSKNRKITYIPQLYINYLVEKDNKEDLNSLIKNILLQDRSYKVYFEEKMNDISVLTNRVQDTVRNYLETRVHLNEAKQKSDELGNSQIIAMGIITIEKQIEEFKKKSTFKSNELDEYNNILEEKSRTDRDLLDLVNQEMAFKKIVNEFETSGNELFGKTNSQNNQLTKGLIGRILTGVNNISLDVSLFFEKVELDYKKIISNITVEIEKREFSKNKAILSNKLDATTLKLKPFQERLSEQSALQQLVEKLEQERRKLTEAQDFEKQFQNLSEHYTNLRYQIADFLKERYLLYIEICDHLNTVKNSIAEGINLHAKVSFKLSKFRFYDQTNKASVSNDNYFNTLFTNGEVNYLLIPEMFNHVLRLHNGHFNIGSLYKIPLKQNVTIEDVIMGLIEDKLEIDYSVTYKGDELLKMSPGKKGTVLLILFLQISSSEYPILIDQPEDNLDNRTIYDLLCQIIKKKKQDRQIIIVSHNANLVVSTDAENIIVANQEGQDAPAGNGVPKFGYVNGSIEYSFSRLENDNSILYQQGIREHVCDILEGGDVAFKQREMKYDIK